MRSDKAFQKKTKKHKGDGLKMISYNYVVKYVVNTTCLSPVRSGNNENNPETLLTNCNEQLMIQASSLVGAFGEYIEKYNGKETRERLFGKQTLEGILRISDLVFDKEKTNTRLRPRVRIDQITGTAAGKAKFAVNHIAKDSKGKFELWLFAESKNVDDEKLIESALSALNNGQIILGAQKTNGFGLVSLNVEKNTYDLKNDAELDAWLNDKSNNETPVDLDKEKETDYIIFTLSGKIENFLIKDLDVEVINKKRIAVNISEPTANGNKPVIPGSSFKGVIKNACSLIAKKLNVPQSEFNKYFGADTQKNSEGKNKPVPGRILFSDTILDKRNYHEVTRIRIDRFSGGVISNALLNERLETSDKVELTVKVPKDAQAMCALILFALRDMAEGRLNIGSGYNAGHGFFKDAYVTAVTPDGKQIKVEHEKNLSDNEKALWNEWYNALNDLRETR